MKFFAIVVSLLLACSEVGAGTAQNDLKAGERFEKQEQFFRAAQAYSRALRPKPGNPKARRALELVADRAIEEKLRKAEALEAELKTSEAIAELDAAGGLRDRLAELGIESRQAREITPRRDDLVSHRVQALLAEAEGARAEGLWSAAIAHLQRVDTLRPGSEDTHGLLYDLWVSWGEMNVREGRLRAAAERFEQAALLPGARSSVAAARAAAIRIGLGTSALGKGACRAAVADLRKAEQLAAGSVLPELLRQSASCAGTCVRLTTGADPDAGISKEQLELLGAEVRKRIRAGASEFLRLRSSGPPDTETCEPRSMPGVDGGPMKVGPYSSTVRVSAISIIRQPASSVTRQTRIQHGSGLDTVGTYEEYREALTGTISGWITLADSSSTGIHVPLPVQASGQATAMWRRSPVSTINRENAFTGQRSTTVMIDVADRGKAQADTERRQARSDLEATLIRNFATEAAQRLLSTVDVEPAVADSSELPGVEMP